MPPAEQDVIEGEFEVIERLRPAKKTKHPITWTSFWKEDLPAMIWMYFPIAMGMIVSSWIKHLFYH